MCHSYKKTTCAVFTHIISHFFPLFNIESVEDGQTITFWVITARRIRNLFQYVGGS
jgi:hypothetical protein